MGEAEVLIIGINAVVLCDDVLIVIDDSRECVHLVGINLWWGRCGDFRVDF